MMEDYGCAAERRLRTFLALKNGIPSHDTFSRLFGLLNPAGLQTALLRLWRRTGRTGSAAESKLTLAQMGGRQGE